MPGRRRGLPAAALCSLAVNALLRGEILAFGFGKLTSTFSRANVPSTATPRREREHLRCGIPRSGAGIKGLSLSRSAPLGKDDAGGIGNTIESVVKDVVSDINIRGKSNSGTGKGGRKKRGKRVTFFASERATRELATNATFSDLLDEYMTLPLEQYSVRSFHDSCPDRSTEARRWFLRRLSAEESRPYLQFEARDNHDDYMEDTSFADPEAKEIGRFFRLAVPLAPLVGVKLTPVIDLEVIPATISQVPGGETLGSPADGQISGVRDQIGERAFRRGPLRRVFRRRHLGNQRRESGGDLLFCDPGVVRMQSLRVSLLSTEDEVTALMKESKTTPRPKATPTQVSRNPSVRQIGNDAIGVVGKIEEFIQPHITFDATISWNNGAREAGDDSIADHKLSITIRSTAVTSLTIPPLPVVFRTPLPIGVLIRRIGTVLTKKTMDVALPRFLRQLERDFERWARGSDKR